MIELLVTYFLICVACGAVVAQIVRSIHFLSKSGGRAR